MVKKTRKSRALSSGLFVLRTELEIDLDKMLAEISLDIGPIDFLERTWVDDTAFYTLEKMRYRRIKTRILDNALAEALERILRRIRFAGPHSMSAKLFIENWKASENASHEWLYDQESRRQVLSLLEEAGYDEAAIEAEAFISVADQLEKADRMLNSTKESLDKTIRSLAKYRKSLAAHVRRNADRVLAAGELPSLVNVSVN